MASMAEQLMFEYADEVNSQVNRRRAVIEPPEGEYGEREIFADTATVMSPASLTIQDSKGSLDLTNTPSMLNKIAEQISSETSRQVSVDINDDTTSEMNAIEQHMETNERLRHAILDLARMIETKLDDLTDTNSLASKRQIEEARRTTEAAQEIEQAQTEMLEYQKEKDFDDARPVSSENPVSTDTAPVTVPEEKESKGWWSTLMGSKAGRGGRFARILGFAGRGLLGFAGAALLADSITRQFFGKDLITTVKDGFTYLLDNWDKLLVKGITGIFDIVMDMPKYLSEALSGIGKVIGATLLSILNKVPGLSQFLPSTTEEMFTEDSSGQDVFDRNSGLTQLAGAGGVAALVGTQGGRSVLGKTASMLTGGLLGSKSEPDTPATSSTKAPETSKPGLLKRGFNALRSSKYGKILAAGTVATGGLLALTQDDQDTPEAGVPQVTDDSSSFGLVETAGAAGLAGMGAYAYKNRSGANIQSSSIPDPKYDIPKPVNGANGAVGNLMKPAAKTGQSASKAALKTIGRLPGLSAAMSAYDVFSAANDDTLTQKQKNKEYAGAGGSLAGGLGGAALGATVGSVVPVVGTAIGGFLGGIAGAIYGEEGVEAIYDWITAPTESTGQAMTSTGVGKENLKDFQTATSNEFDAQLDSIPGMPDLKPESNPYVGPLRDDVSPTVDQKVMYMQEAIKNISEKSVGTTSIQKIEEAVERASNVTPIVSSNTEYLTTSGMENMLYNGTPISDISPNIVSETPALETGIENNETIRDQTSTVPEINVVVNQPAPVPKKPKGVVAKKVTPNKPKEKQSVFNNVPRLNNVPVVMDDTGFVLLNQGYV